MTGVLQNVLDGLSLGSLYALAALGVGLLFGILRLINFAHGDFISFGAYALIVPSADVTARMLIGTWPLPLMLLAVTLLVIVLALVCDLLVFRFLRSAPAPSLMIGSFAVGYIIQNTILMVYGARPKAIDLWSSLDRQVAVGSLHLPLLQPISIGVTIVLMVALSLLLKYSPIGVQMRAAAENFLMARYLGVRANLVIAVAFAISGALAAVVSLLFVSQTGTLSPTMATQLLLYAFIATVIGGMGSLRGAVVGGLLVGMISSLLQAYLPADLRSFREAFVFSIVIAILVFRPSGLLRSKALTQRV